MANRRIKRGLTLIELLLAVALTSIIGSAVYAVFAQGLRAWNRIGQAKPDYDTAILFEKMTGDLRNLTVFNGSYLAGTSDAFSFYAGTGADARDSAQARSPKHITYGFDPKLRSVVRRERDLSEILAAAGRETAHETAGRVSQFEIAYFYFDDRKNEDVWLNQWNDATCFPEGLKISLTYGSKKAERKIFRFIPIPLGGCTVT